MKLQNVLSTLGFAVVVAVVIMTVAPAAHADITPPPVPEPGMFVTGGSMAAMVGIGLLRGRINRKRKDD